MLTHLSILYNIVQVLYNESFITKGHGTILTFLIKFCDGWLAMSFKYAVLLNFLNFSCVVGSRYFSLGNQIRNGTGLQF